MRARRQTSGTHGQILLWPFTSPSIMIRSASGTTVNVNVQVSVDVLEAAPADHSADFDHVVEVSLYSSNGRIIVMGCTDYEPEAQRFAAQAGWLRLRASRRNLDRASRADIDAATGYGACAGWSGLRSAPRMSWSDSQSSGRRTGVSAA